MKQGVYSMTSKEKAELLKNTIYQLYSKEGRSISYISRLLEINRKTLGTKIKEWNFPEAEPRRHASPSTQKFINQHKELILSRFKNNVSISEVARELGITRDFLQRTVLKCDLDLRSAADEMIEKNKHTALENKSRKLNESNRQYDYEIIKDEIWKEIPHYNGYEISNYGRVRKYAKRHNEYYLLSLAPNKNNNRLYVSLHDGNKRKNIQVSRLVALMFVENPNPEINKTVNHKDGNVENNYYENLEWVTQGQNNKHAYDNSLTPRIKQRRFVFKSILYKGKYEFKTVSAFAKFIDKSETQARRYLENPEKHDIQIIL